MANDTSTKLYIFNQRIPPQHQLVVALYAVNSNGYSASDITGGGLQCQVA